MVAVKAIIPHINPDFTPYGGTAVVFALIYQAVFIPAFSLPASDTALGTSGERRLAIRTLHFIDKDWLTPLTLYQCFFHKGLWFIPKSPPLLTPPSWVNIGRI